MTLYCVDGPLAGHQFDRPEGLTGDPPLVVLETRGGVYLASPPCVDGWPTWEAWWLPVGERARELVAS